MKLIKIDPNKVKIPELRVTARFDEEKFAMFKESMKTTGQVAPIICVLVDGEVVLVDGQHRLLEAIENKEKFIQAAITEGDMVDVLTKNIFVDHLRGKTPPSEMRKVVQTLFDEYHVGIEDIVKKTGLSQDYVEKLLIISKLTPMCLEALDDEKIGVGIASELTKARSPDQQEIFLQMTIANRWTLRQLKEFMTSTREIEEQRAEPVVVTSAPVSTTVGCRFCGDEYPPQQLATMIMCHNCQGVMFEAVAAGRRLAQEAAKEAERRESSPKESTKS